MKIKLHNGNTIEIRKISRENTFCPAHVMVQWQALKNGVIIMKDYSEKSIHKYVLRLLEGED